MLRIWMLALMLFTIGSIARAKVPSACRECMSQCPHDTRDLKACDRGCPKVCTKDQAAEFGSGMKACKACMAECPHQTRDLKACDRGCPGICTPDQVELIKSQEGVACKACMAECPHQTRDLKACDQGCPGVCHSGGAHGNSEPSTEGSAGGQ